MPVKFRNGMGPQDALGHIKEIREKKGKESGEAYAHILLDMPHLINKETVVETCKFFIHSKLWKNYKRMMKPGQAWHFKYRLTGNRVNDEYYLNASVVSANMFWFQDEQTGQNQGAISQGEQRVASNSKSSDHSHPNNEDQNRAVLNEIHFDREF